MVTSKLSVIAMAWGLAFLVSAVLRFWGISHPDPFKIRIFLVWFLVFGPSLILGTWIFVHNFRSSEI